MIDAQQLFADLTSPQAEAVRHSDGPLLIIAGAGSGKTRVLTRRVAHLVSLGIPASSILAITFTNKAAGEMKQRIESLLGRHIRDFGRLDQPWPTICTFHSLCLRILRHYAPQIGLANNFSIYDTGDQNRVIKDALKTLDLSTTNFPPANVHGKISNAKNQLLGPEDFAKTAGDFYSKTVARVYTKYQKLLESNNALDFDDLLLRTAAAFRDHPQMLRELQDRYQYILIDEYQDTNHAQYVLAHALAQRHRNMCVVGDPDQSIYAWRGADIRNIMEFEQDYPDATVVRLEQNYRSTKTILSIASKLIAHNRRRKDKTLWTENPQGDKATLYLCGDEHDEAYAVTQRLKELKAKHDYSWNQMAIFYRMNALSRVMEDALRKENVPYFMARGVEFYNRKEIKDTLAYLRVIANPNDEVNLERIANTPARGISDSTLKQLANYALSNGMSLFQALCDVDKVTGPTARANKAVKNFVGQVIAWRQQAFADESDADEAGGGDDMFSFSGSPQGRSTGGAPAKGQITKLLERVVRESGLEEYYKKLGGDELDELNNINELISSAAEYDAENPDGSVVDYLAQVSLVSDTDRLKDNGGAVTMMTLHAAKGLEFPVVAMIGLEEGVLPHSRARGNEDELEEERRLCFVGVTRAQERLILSKATHRTVRGLRERTIASPFLNEMSQQDLEVIDRSGVESFDSDDEDDYVQRQMEQAAQRLGAQFKRGQLVRHKQFGLGRVSEITPMGSQTRAIIEFNTVGRKTLILEYAKLEAVG